MNLSYRKKFFVHVLLIALFLSAAGFGGWVLFGRVVGAGEAIALTKDQLAALKKEQEQVGELTKRHEHVKRLMSSLENPFFALDDKLSLVLLIERVAQEASVYHGINAVQESVSSSSDEGALSLNMSVGGSFPNVLKFIYLLEHSEYYVAVQTAQISRAEGGGAGFSRLEGREDAVLGKNDVRVQLALRVYMQ